MQIKWKLFESRNSGDRSSTVSRFFSVRYLNARDSFSPYPFQPRVVSASRGLISALVCQDSICERTAAGKSVPASTIQAMDFDCDGGGEKRRAPRAE